MKTFYHTHILRADDTRDSYQTRELKNKEKNGKLYVLLNSRWYRVWDLAFRYSSDGKTRMILRNSIIYIGCSSDKFQNKISIEE